MAVPSHVFVSGKIIILSTHIPFDWYAGDYEIIKVVYFSKTHKVVPHVRGSGTGQCKSADSQTSEV
jgi:hypothetical protein